MKRFTSLLLVAPLFVGCGGESENSEDGLLAFEGVTRYTLDPFVSAADALPTDTMTGRWVMLYERQSRRYDEINAQVSPRNDSSALNVVILREVAEENTGYEYEIADCDGGFSPVTISEDGVVSGLTFYADPDGDNRLKYKASGTRFVPLSQVSGYYEDYIITVSLVRVSEDSSSLGDLTMNWSDEEGQRTDDVSCFSVTNLSDDARRIAYAGSEGNLFSVSSDTRPPALDALADSPDRSAITNYYTMGEQSVNVTESTSSVLTVEYSITSATGITVTGTASGKLLD
ncbi:MAG: hypothetical protein VW258_14945 [Thalassolituus sp.]